MRERLVERPGLPAALRAAIAAATTADMSGYAAEAHWLDPRRADRIARDGREQAFVAIAADAPREELPELVAWLGKAGHLTVALLLRALASGDGALFAQSLSDMTGVPLQRVAGLLREPRGQGFPALYARSGLPAHLAPAFRIAAECAGEAHGAGVGVNYALTMKMLRAIEALDDPALSPLTAMLWRLAGEGAREDAREFAAQAQTPAPQVEIEIEAAPEAIEAEAPPVLLLNVEPSNENFAPPIELDLATPEPAAVAA